MYSTCMACLRWHCHVGQQCVNVPCVVQGPALEGVFVCLYLLQSVYASDARDKFGHVRALHLGMLSFL